MRDSHSVMQDIHGGRDRPGEKDEKSRKKQGGMVTT
jgi:hypothetical protein